MADTLTYRSNVPRRAKGMSLQKTVQRPLVAISYLALKDTMKSKLSKLFFLMEYCSTLLLFFHSCALVVFN